MPIPYRYVNYKKLDVVEVKVIRPCPIRPQTENLLVNLNSFHHRGTYKPGIADLYRRYVFHSSHPCFLGSGQHKYDSIDIYDHSIEIAYATDFSVVKEQYGNKARFSINHISHRFFSVTDTDYDTRKQQEQLDIGNAWVVATLPNSPYVIENVPMGYYIFIAAIYPA